MEHILYAGRWFKENEFTKALQEIWLGYLIDPFNEQLAKLESQITAALGEG
ncbi:MAG: hypothetical protein WCX28_11740 [Bacteriovoracaceae bacterium]|nr:hypothetical protein [Bacteroidota bacterium]